MRKSLTRLDGVSQAIVNRKTGTAIVTYDPSRVDFSRMTKATANSGFASTVRSAKGSE